MLYSVPVNLIRQWCYCPRVVHYQATLNIAVKRPRWVEQGEKFHELEQKLWKRRNLSRFGLEKGKRYYQHFLSDEALGMHGIVDMAIETESAVYPIEFKLLASHKSRGTVLQLVAYATLLEKQVKKISSHAFIVGKGKALYTIEITDEKRKTMSSIVTQIRETLFSGIKPDSSASIAQCCNCEYINYCNDRL